MRGFDAASLSPPVSRTRGSGIDVSARGQRPCEGLDAGVGPSMRCPTGRPRSGMLGGSCWTKLIASALSARHKSRRLKSSLPLEEVRADVGFLLDRVVVAIDAVGDERVVRNDRVLVGLDRVQSDHCGMGPGIPFERGRTLGLLA